MAGELLDDDAHLTRQVGMPRVEAGAHVTRADFAKKIHHVPDMAEQKMRQHVLQQQLNAQFTAARGDPVERFAGMPHALEELGLGRAAFALRPGMQHHVVAAQKRGGLAGADQFLHRCLTRRVIQ